MKIGTREYKDRVIPHPPLTYLLMTYELLPITYSS